MSAASPTVYVIVLSWNGRALLKTCLASLRQQSTPPRVIVVDNGSTDGSPELVRAKFPEMLLIENGRNLGFSEGNNVGIRRAIEAGADHVALLNQDAQAHPRWLESLVHAAETDATVAAVASRLVLHSHQTLLNSTGIVVNQSGCGWDRGFARLDGPQWRVPGEVLGASGGAMLLRVEALRRVGLFDPAYFAYYEDLDLSVRLWEAGFKVVYAPDAVATHHFSSTLGDESSRKVLLMHSNRWRFIAKHFPLARFTHPRSLVAPDVRFLNRLRTGSSGLRLWLHAYARTLAMIWSACRYRLRWRKPRGRAERWWHFVTPAVGYPDLRVPALDYRLIERPSDAWTDRLLMGISDSALGPGWYPLVRPEPTTFAEPADPAWRGFGAAATCFLRVGGAGPYVVQLHVTQPAQARDARDLRVICNDRPLGRRAIAPEHGGWRTLHFPVTVPSDTVRLDLSVENPVMREQSGEAFDYGLKVNEISVLRPDSPLLRGNSTSG